jgi:hypothetical protein
MTACVRFLVLAPLLIMTACADDDGDPPSAADASTSSDPATGSETTAPASTSAGEESTGSPASPFDCVEQSFAPSPLAGPGLDPETGAIVGHPQSSYVLHTTQAVLDPETVQAFDVAVGEVLAQLQATDGLIALSLSADMQCGYARTLGIWESEEAMLTFVATGAHAQAMADGPNLIATGRFTHFDIDPTDIENAWDIALERIQTVDPLYGY